MNQCTSRKITFQVGVDIIGNPIFITHHIIQDNPNQTNKEPKERFLAVLTSTFKQY